jgi:hypothetical protein
MSAIVAQSMHAKLDGITAQKWMRNQAYLRYLLFGIGKEFVKRIVGGAAENNGILPHFRVTTGRRNWRRVR